MPRNVTTDGGKEFNNKTLIELLKTYNIGCHVTTALNPDSNAYIERLHSTLIEHVRILKQNHIQDSITQHMKIAIMAYNNTKHSTTNYTPYELLFVHSNFRDLFDLYYTHKFYEDYNEKHKNRLKLLYRNIADKTKEKKIKVIEKRNENLNEINLQPGQTVFSKIGKKFLSKSKPIFKGPFQVIEINPDNTVKVKEFKYHAHTLKPGIISDAGRSSSARD